MKKLLTAAAFALIAASALAAKTKLTVKNTLGADLDELGDYDLYTRTKETDVNDDTASTSCFALGDQFQIELESAQVNGRFRLEALYTDADDAAAKLVIAPSGFVHIRPDTPLGVAAGTSFAKYFAIPSAYLAAADDTTKYGRLLTDSLGHDAWFTSGDTALYANGFAGGVTSSWHRGDFDEYYLHLAGGATVYPDGSDTEKAVDFGVNAGIADRFDVGFTAHDLTEDDRKFGVFAGLTGVQDFILNAAFYYNFTASDYLPEERVTKSSADEFKKQSAKYALGLSSGYTFVRSGFGIYADVISGLTNEYIGKIKYYDSDGNLIDTETTTIVRGGTIVKYKNGTAKRTDGFTHEGVPLYSQLRLTYRLAESVEAACALKLRTLLRATDTRWITVYPRLTVTLPQKTGSIGAGLRLDMNAARYDGVSGISFPVSYTYKFKKKL